MGPLSDEMKHVEDNLALIRDRIHNAARAAGKKSDDILLLAATKTVAVEVINHVIERGVRCVGENRVQELLDKYDRLDKRRADRHFIGHLQTNKVKYLADKVSMIHSVDSVRLAGEIDRQCGKIGKIMNVLVEVNVGGEESKSGVAVSEAENLIRAIADRPNLRVRGLMVIPPFTADHERTKQYFSGIYKLFVDIAGKKIDNVSMDFLSMGMSDDYELAIASGANIVRIGSALFGSRNRRE